MTEPGGVLVRDQARDVLMAFWEHARGPLSLNPEDYLDALARCVRPAAIDRDALIEAVPSAILDSGGEAVYGAVDWGRVADRVLALVRPVAGVTLIPGSDEATLAVTALRRIAAEQRQSSDQTVPGFEALYALRRGLSSRAEALAARLEAGAAS